MSATRVVRPVVRSFKWPFLQEAASWVLAGGHAVVWLSPRKARLVFAKPPDGDDLDLGRWSALDLGRSEFEVAKKGPFVGMAYLRIPHDCYAIVRERVLRDSVHPEAKREMALDCLLCAACCRDNRVELDSDDVARFVDAGRGELARMPYARREDGTIVLVLRKDKRCKHLEEDNRCGVYALRPSACSTFPPGSECCLSSREAELGVVDGAEGPD
ncbi:MAG: YkgJ family cysteine cluster protein [Myxococcota bacterium]|nr:YkgJ family cysteine cluster protein [Myxococcota bacterium]